MDILENIRGALIIKWLGLRTDGMKGPDLNPDAGRGCSFYALVARHLVNSNFFPEPDLCV